MGSWYNVINGNGRMKKLRIPVSYLYAAISIIFWSTSATVTKILLGGINSLQVVMVSTPIAFVFLLIVNAVKGNLKEIKTYRPKDYAIM